MKRVGLAVSAVLILLGVFWTGRESEHGMAALWEHWWCPLPLVAIALGAVVAVSATLIARHPSSTA